jgi:hypothetical protein
LHTHTIIKEKGRIIRKPPQKKKREGSKKRKGKDQKKEKGRIIRKP